MREPTDEFCKSDTGILVPECPSCIDKLFELARKYQEQNIQLQSDIRRARAEGAAEEREEVLEIMEKCWHHCAHCTAAIRARAQEIERRKGGGA